MYPADEDFLTQSGEEQGDEQWRSELASRLNHYRARKKKRHGANASLELDFEQVGQPPSPQSRIAAAVAERFHPAEITCDTNYYRRLNAESSAEEPAHVAESYMAQSQSEETTAAADMQTTDAPASDSGGPGYDPDFDFDRPRELASTEPAAALLAPGKLIYFPKPTIRLPIEPPMVQPTPADQLAEPMSSAPRILDVPEEIIPTIEGPLFADIHLDTDAPEEQSSQLSAAIDLPLQVALLSQRFFAGLVDGLIVLLGSGVFAAIASRRLGELPHGKAALAACAVVPVIFWFVYHYLLLVYAGKTAGMGIAGISLRGFDGQLPDWRRRRRRVYSMLFSLVSLGLGFAWALVDEDCLCWHDRITRTFTTPQ